MLIIVSGSLKKTVSAPSEPWQPSAGLKHDVGHIHSILYYSYWPESSDKSVPSDPQSLRDFEIFIEKVNQKLIGPEPNFFNFSDRSVTMLLYTLELLTLAKYRSLDFTGFNLNEYTEDLILFMRKDCDINKGIYKIHIDDEVQFNNYSYDKKCLMIRFIFETIYNAGKYAKDTIWSISIIKTPNTIRLYYLDYGLGFNFDNNNNVIPSSSSKGGFGLNALRADVEALNGTLITKNHQSDFGTGAIVKLEFPIVPNC